MKNIKEQIEFNGIVINRVPSWAKEIFKLRAQEDFSNDYGMLLVSLLKDSDEYNRLKEMFFNNELDIQLVLNKKEEKEIVEDKKIPTNLAGEPIKFGGKNE